MDDGDLLHQAYDASYRRRLRAVRRHRARVVTGTVAVAAAVAAIACAPLVVGDDSRSVQPVHTPTVAPTPTPTPTSVQTPDPDTARTPSGTAKPRVTGLSLDQLVSQGDLQGIAFTGESTLSLWRRCNADDVDNATCRWAWMLSGGPAVIGEYPAQGHWLAVTAAGDRFIVADSDAACAGLVIDADGKQVPLHQGSGGPSGHLVVVSGKPSQLVDPSSGACWPLPTPAGVDGLAAATISDGGEIWAMEAPSASADISGGVQLWHSRDGRTWSKRSLTTGEPTMPGYVLTSRDHVAALATSDGATELPVKDLATTSDGGRTWHDLGKEDVPFGYVSTMAATSDGTLFVVGGDPETLDPPVVYRSTNDAWTRFVPLQMPKGFSPNGSVFPGGPVVVVESGSGEDPDLAAVDDDGQVTRWTNPLR